jgi:16S rRNA (uracil1498-N3)-methyltransferase
VITLLVDPERLADPELTVEGDAYHHLFRVRRTAAGERLRLVDGRGRARWAQVARVERKAAALSLLEGEAGEAPANEADFDLHLLVPTLRPERAAWLVEKATEVGVFAFHFYQSERAPRSFGAGAVERLARVAAGAVEQSHRSRLPEITGPHRWGELDALTANFSASRWILDPTAGERGLPRGRPIGNLPGAGALLVGPEGGWTDGERAALAASGWTPAGLGERILRIETAAVVGAAALLLP